MKRLFLTVAMLSGLLVLGMGCATSQHEMTPAPAATSSAPSKAAPPTASSEQKEIVTPPVALPPAEGQTSSGSK